MDKLPWAKPSPMSPTPMKPRQAASLPPTSPFVMPRELVNLVWLIRLRWAAVVGQTLTIAATQIGLTNDLPAFCLYAVVGCQAVSNGALAYWYRRGERRAGTPFIARHGHALLGLIMTADLLFLSTLLYFSGGPTNPFSVFYIVHISLAAAVLPARWALSLTVLAVTFFGLLFVQHVPLAALDHGPPAHGEPSITARAESAEHGSSEPDNHSEHGTVRFGVATDDSMRLHLQGMLLAFAGAATFVTYFVTRVRTALTWRENQLALAEQRQSQAEKFESLVALAAGAAHELSTPLAAALIAAHEVELALTADPRHPEATDDIRVVCQEIARCREILQSLATKAGQSFGEPWEAVTLRSLLENALCEPTRISMSVTALDAERRMVLPREAVSQAFRAILKNALAAAPDATVRVSAQVPEDHVQIVIEDDGGGMSPEVLARIGEPFFTTREPGQGLGLGIFLAKRVLERLGGNLDYVSEVGRGTRAAIRLPLVPRGQTGEVGSADGVQP